MAALKANAEKGCEKSKAVVAKIEAIEGTGCDKTKAAEMAKLKKAAKGGCETSKAAYKLLASNETKEDAGE